MPRDVDEIMAKLTLRPEDFFPPAQPRGAPTTEALLLYRPTLRREDFYFTRGSTKGAPVTVAPPLREVDEIGKLLLEAANVLERDGWCRGQLTHEGRHCTAHAIMTADGKPRAAFDDELSDTAQAAIKRLENFVGDHVCGWNNSQHSVEDVTAGLRAAAVHR